MKGTPKTIKLAVICGALVLLVFACGRRRPGANRAESPPSTSGPGTTSQASPSAASPGSQAGGGPEAIPGQAAPVIGPVEAKTLDRDLKFDHNRPEHKRQDCSLCHKRPDNSPTPRFPGHAGCIACHTADYTSVNTKLCQVCHVIPLEAFPKLAAFPEKLDQFGVKEFSHRQHLDPARMPQGTAVARCDSCHQFDAKLIRANFPGHPQCYTCHTHQPGEKLGSCGGCHADQSVALKYNKSLGNALALYNFTHGGHFKSASIDRKCEKCHRTVERDLQHPDILQINTARGQRHTSGCWNCHVQAREPVCTKCHIKGLPL